MEWEAAAIVLSVRPYGESSVLAHLFNEEHGVCHAMVRGGASRRQASLWQVGNLVMARWKARLSDQLGSASAELVQSPAAMVLDRPLPLAMITSACALTDGALAERAAHPELFMQLVRLLTLIAVAPEPPPMAFYLRWEKQLLSELGYGIALDVCAVTGVRENLGYVSPKTGRAVSEAGAGSWKDRLLPLPDLFLDDSAEGHLTDWYDGLHLTGYFLAKSVFGARHLPLPAARERLLAQIMRLREGPSVTGMKRSGSEPADDIGISTYSPD